MNVAKLCLYYYPYNTALENCGSHVLYFKKMALTVTKKILSSIGVSTVWPYAEYNRGRELGTDYPKTVAYPISGEGKTCYNK